MFLVRASNGTNVAPAAANTNEETAPAAQEPVQLYRRLDGMPVATQDEADARGVGVMVENLPVTRPQFGLSAASVVYESLVEGGATRFLALYPATLPSLAAIGPVRSVRPYYLEWLAEYNGAIAHAGGSPEALAVIWKQRVFDIDGIGNAAKYFWRDRSLAAPHNLFTSSAKLAEKLAETEDTFTGLTPWAFKDEAPLAGRPADDQFVRVKFSSFSFEAEFRYRAATNTYARFNAGAPHLDANTGQQLQAKNVIVQVIRPIDAIGEKGRLSLFVGGTGRAFIFVDGVEHIGTWRKDDRTSRTEYFFEDGSPARLNRGQTWVEVVPSDRSVEAGVIGS